MRALVTGANGFVGGYLIDYLSRSGYEVIGTTRKLRGNINRNIQWELMDILDETNVHEVILKWKPDCIFHLAATAITTLGNVDSYYHNNIIGTVNVLNTIEKSVPKCKILLISSSSVYGHVSLDQIPIQEDAKINPYNHYAASKAALEIVAKPFIANGLDIVIARAFNHTGPRQTTDYVCSKFAKQFADIVVNGLEPIIEVGNVKVARDFTDVRDIVEAYELLIRFGHTGEIYNVCSGQAYELEEIINWLSDFSKVKVQTRIISNILRKQDASVVIGDNRKIFNLTGWKSKIPLKQTIQDLFMYWKGDREV